MQTTDKTSIGALTHLHVLFFYIQSILNSSSDKEKVIQKRVWKKRQSLVK